MEEKKEELISHITTFDLHQYGATEYDFVEQSEFFLEENLRREIFGLEKIKPEDKLSKGVLFITFRKPKFVCLELKRKEGTEKLEFETDMVTSLPVSKMFVLPRSSYHKNYSISHFSISHHQKLEDIKIQLQGKKTENNPKILLISHPTHIPYVIYAKKMFPQPLLKSDPSVPRYPPLFIKKLNNDNFALYACTDKLQLFSLKSKKILFSKKQISNFKFQYIVNKANLEMIKLDGISFEEGGITRFSGLKFSIKKRSFLTFELKGIKIEDEKWESLEGMQYNYAEYAEDSDFSKFESFLIFGFNSRYDLGSEKLVFVTAFKDKFREEDTPKRFEHLSSFRVRHMCNRMKVVGFKGKDGKNKHYLILDKSFGKPFFLNIYEYDEEKNSFKEVFYQEFDMRVRVSGYHEGIMSLFKADKTLMVYKFNEYDNNR